VTSIQVGAENEALVQSYVASRSRSMPELNKQPIATQEKSLALKVNQKSQTNADAKSNKATASSRGVAVDELSALLHDAIQAKQQYPASAMEMEREGRVRVGFILQPTGIAQQIELIQSSGTSSLDAAGLQAVRDAMPFKQVDRYLANAREFQIDVVFALR
jgi:TonB family protein